MIKRYGTEEMREIWSEERKFRNWARVEIAVLQAKVKLGLLNVTIPEDLLESLKIDVEEINRIEREETKHDVIAFLMHTSIQLPVELRPFWHEKMTSYDTQDTALSLAFVASTYQLRENLMSLMNEIKIKAYKHKLTAQIGRTHGVHAEPITFGVKLANWYDELKRHQERLKWLSKLVARGKISGAVGMYTLDPEVEKLTCEYLELTPIVATQIISRDLIAEYMTNLAIIGGTIEKITTSIRTMQRTEILEVQEFFSKTQTAQ